MDLIRRHRIAVLCMCALVTLGVGGHFLVQPEERPVTAQVEIGDVISSVTVSGIARATEAARLRFTDSGRITDILVSKGDSVARGDVLALLDQTDIDAERREAMAGLSRVLAERDELVQGPTNETRESISATVQNARAELARVRTEEAEKVAAARRTYLGSGLTLVPETPSANDTAPTVGGSYQCDTEGVYTFEVYRSSAPSGYSYRLSGLESGTYTAYTEADGAFGSCGLTLRFDPDEFYRPMVWTLAIPNPRGAQYTANQNALMLAEEQERNAIAAANDSLTQALADAVDDVASPRSEALRRADADIETALARVAHADALRERRVIRAPFAGIVTDIIPNVGEVTPANDFVLALVSANAFEVVARIPEIDITKVDSEDRAALVFDAKDTESVPAQVVFLSPLASPVDGVAYFDATILMDTVPTWVREGLNADVEIVIDERNDVARLPRRFLTERDGTTYATILESALQKEVAVTVDLVGTDGYAAVDLVPSTVVVAPPSLTP